MDDGGQQYLDKEFNITYKDGFYEMTVTHTFDDKTKEFVMKANVPSDVFHDGDAPEELFWVGDVPGRSQPVRTTWKIIYVYDKLC